MNILITGCGGDIGQSVCKAIKGEYPDWKVYGCDCNDKHAGHFIFDKCMVVPKVDNISYFDRVAEIIKSNSIDIIIPMSEPELRYFHLHKINEIKKRPLIMVNDLTMKAGFNKLTLHEFLVEWGLPCPWTTRMQNGPRELPCIAKPMKSSGSRNISIVDERNQDFYKGRWGHQGYHYDNIYDSIFQELLLPKDEEYTCGVYRTLKGEVRTIIFRRTLTGGYTGYGKKVNNKEIEHLLETVAEKLELKGSMNVQLILTKKGPMIFEINPRFSSTVLFRHLLGFKDVIWSIQEHLREKISDYEEVEGEVEIFKGFQEYVRYGGEENQKVNT